MPTINLPKRRDRKPTYNKSAYQKVYQDRRWKRLRKAKLRANPLCEVCRAKGIVTQTEEIHHIIPFDIDGDYEVLAFDFDNLVSLCIQCHKEAHSSRI